MLWPKLASLQDRISGRREGSVSACELSMEAGAPSEVKCELRPPDLSGAPPGDTFEDQMMGVSVLAAENGEKVKFRLYSCNIFKNPYKALICRCGPARRASSARSPRTTRTTP